MNLDAEQIIRRRLTEKVEMVPEAGHVRPAAQFFSGKEDFWATVDQTKVTQRDLEMSLIGATWIYPATFIDDATTGAGHSPRIEYPYEIYIFTGYGLAREDETEMPDIFASKVLKQHNSFVAAWLGIKEQFQKKERIEGFSADEYVLANTLPVVQIEDISQQAVCAFIPGVVGYAVRLRAPVEIMTLEC